MLVSRILKEGIEGTSVQAVKNNLKLEGRIKQLWRKRTKSLALTNL